MAKWGEGDPRWIVEERPDATNVNNWHWKESDATSWSKDKLNELFLQFTVGDDKNLTAKIIEFETLTGEATANNRKGKLIFFYEWDIVMKWEGRILNDEEATKIKGKIAVPNLSEENTLKELEINITTEEYNDKSDILKKFMMEVGRSKIREQLGKYMDGLRSDYAKNLILPRKDDVQGSQATTKAPIVSTNKNVVNKTTDKSAEGKTLGVKIDCKTIFLEEKFQCKAKEIFDCFAKTELMQAFTRDAVKADFVKGGEFALFGGNITGKFDDIVPNEKITKQWRVKSWPTGHYSIAEITFEEKEDHTMLKLKQTLVPTNEYDTTEKNWSRYYFTPIKQTFGFGSFLL